MKKNVLIFLIVIATSINLFGQNVTGHVEDILRLTSTSSTEETLIVKDLSTGGIFIHSESSLLIDNGIVFPRKAGGYWVRDFNKAQGVNPVWWGAKGDGIHDDLPAINEATTYCLENKTILQFPSGVFRITGTWIIGGKTINEDDLFLGKFTEAPSFNMQQHQIARVSSPLIIRGGVNTIIYGDFKSDKLKAIIYYNVSGIGLPRKPSSGFYTQEISNIGIYGQGSFAGVTPTISNSRDTNNKQIGLVMLFCTNSEINRCCFSGLQYGIVFNTTYFGSLRDSRFDLCGTGIFTLNYNTNILENIVGYNCKTLFDITGSQIVATNLVGESCETTLAFKGTNMIVNGIYCENTDLAKHNSYQIVLGTDKNNKNPNDKTTTNVVLNAVTLTAHGRDVVLLEDNMGALNISSGNINGNIVSKSTGSTIIAKNLMGSYKTIGPAKFIKDE